MEICHQKNSSKYKNQVENKNKALKEQKKNVATSSSQIASDLTQAPAESKDFCEKKRGGRCWKWGGKWVAGTNGVW